MAYRVTGRETQSGKVHLALESKNTLLNKELIWNHLNLNLKRLRIGITGNSIQRLIFFFCCLLIEFKNIYHFHYTLVIMVIKGPKLVKKTILGFYS